jgi:peptidyl-tRNA hydrolase, PTH1 family
MLAMKLIVGLGNPGRKYEKTRHNVGFEVLDVVAARGAASSHKEKFSGRIADVTIAGEKTLLLWPHTFMNLSGQSVGAAVEFYQVPLSDVLVICDDFNLPLGKLRIRGGGSAGGQNGLDSIIKRLGTQDVPRLRLGIGPVPEAWEAPDFVLSKFNRSDRTVIDETIDRAAEAVECWVAEGLSAGMNKFN